MGDEIVIDKTTFFNRLSSFYTAWKSDKRSSHPAFGGVGSIVILMGKTDEANSFQKNNAIHVCRDSCNDVIRANFYSSGCLVMNFRLPF
jgi:nucleosome binding factor SPN SPT16 subunit